MAKGIIIQYYQPNQKLWYLYHREEKKVLETRPQIWAAVPVSEGSKEHIKG